MDGQIIFTNRERLDEYSKELLSLFIGYLNDREAHGHQTIKCGSHPYIIESEDEINRFLSYIDLED